MFIEGKEGQARARKGNLAGGALAASAASGISSDEIRVWRASGSKLYRLKEASLEGAMS